MHIDDVAAAVATPPGRGAVGIVRLSGPGCLQIAARFLRPPPPPEPRFARLVWAFDGEERLDQVLATYFPEGASFTGEEMLEISAHGSPYILGRLLELCLQNGARSALPGEFTQRAFLHGRLDLAQAEAVCELIQARTRLDHRAAVERLEGGLSRKAGALRARLLELRARLEACLDHPDDDIPAPELSSGAARLSGEIRALLLGGMRHLRRDGARIAIVGLPNAGKSSLLNALLGRERAIVSDVPGTTRDTIEESVDLDGMEGVLVDTAGLREEARDPLEREGQARARAALDRADLALLVIDRTRPFSDSRELLRSLSSGPRPMIAVLNKSDAGAACSARDLSSESPGLRVAEVSALRGDGVPELAALLRRELAEDRPASRAVEVNARHRAALEECAADLDAASELARAREGEGLDLAAARLRGALEALDAVVGAGAPDELLAEIFSRFCVGK